jgi:hypothetical protein
LQLVVVVVVAEVVALVVAVIVQTFQTPVLVPQVPHAKDITVVELLAVRMLRAVAVVELVLRVLLREDQTVLAVLVYRILLLAEQFTMLAVAGVVGKVLPVLVV